MSERCVVAVDGVVQGVGFRPYVHQLATSLNLRGLVRNDSDGVLVELEGERAAIGRFLQELRVAPPPLAAIDTISVLPGRPGSYSGFTIAASDLRHTPTALISPDMATCAACRAELFDPANRRFRYPFINCTNCGPRFTIVHAAPYDRARTSMAHFVMCAACRREYEDPRDRRFHAQPIACAECGPALGYRPARGPGEDQSGDRALLAATAALLAGLVVAIKGLGGYHLACDALNQQAVERLRARKHREAKPFAVMVEDLSAAQCLAQVGNAEAALLQSPAQPIVLLRKPATPSLAEAVAPGSDTIGVMLAYTPLHHLLLAEVARPLVMTSGNRSDEPIAFEDAEALSRLEGIADGFLFHDRPITTRCDDSVARVMSGAPALIRRSRGYAPRPIRLRDPFPVPVLALGGHLKNTFCLGRGHHAFLSHHVGDLDHPSAQLALRCGVEHYQRLFDTAPAVVAHDLHPDYHSTRLAARLGLPTIAVQHHHAHVAACLAEHDITGPVLGVVFDGSGYGTDGAVWGGEFLLVDGPRFDRLAHLDYVGLPGGDAAAREPWRMAASHLWSAFGDGCEGSPILARRKRDWAVLRRMLERGFHSPPTSSVGRLFDAVASLVGIADRVAFEAQAAIQLEAVADRGTTRSYPVDLRQDRDVLLLEARPLIRGVVDDISRGLPMAEIAGAFHNAVRDLVVAAVGRLAERTGVRRVALTGGVFQNALLLERTAAMLTEHGYDVLVHRRVPCNDGGLALGQAVVASAIHDSQGG